MTSVQVGYPSISSLLSALVIYLGSLDVRSDAEGGRTGEEAFRFENVKTHRNCDEILVRALTKVSSVASLPNRSSFFLA